MLKIEYWDIEKVQPYANNAKRHPEEHIGGGYINNWIMDKMRQKDGEKRYCARAIISTAFGQLFDDYVFIFLAFAPFGISAIENPWSAILTVPLVSAIVETVIEAVFTPVSKRICTIVKSA